MFFLTYYSFSWLKSKYNDWQNRKKNEYITTNADEPQWISDYELQMQTKFSLFWQYLEIGRCFRDLLEPC